MSASGPPARPGIPDASGASPRVQAGDPPRGRETVLPLRNSGDDARLRGLIREIPDFPKPGIAFKDITPLLADPDALADAVRMLADYARPLRVDCVVAAEARGFLLGPALAVELGAGFVLARKPGKLPYETVSAEYLLEYGAGQLELHTDAVHSGKRVLVHDDLLATGGTAEALCELVEQLGGEIVGCGFLIELAFLNGRTRLAPREAHALLTYES
jgi:adenine phosphoribosyltransferase